MLPGGLKAASPATLVSIAGPVPQKLGLGDPAEADLDAAAADRRHSGDSETGHRRPGPASGPRSRQDVPS